MISFKEAVIKKIISQKKGLIEAEVEVDGRRHSAVGYARFIGRVKEEDRVIVNTTAIELELGTGGEHFILWNLTRHSFSTSDPGHIMKLRYTPLQLACLAVEAQESPHHDLLKEAQSLGGMPVVVGGLHSQLAPVAVAVKEMKPKAKLVYVMTDGAALPLTVSRLVARLKSLGFIDTTITTGQAFGGDIEAINIFSGLVSAKVVAQADITVVIMGPGIVGTGTKLGFSGIEQGEVINAANSLGGRPVVIPRLSFADKRSRHQGVSHHTLTVLSLATQTPAVVTLPQMEEEKMKKVRDQLEREKIADRYKVEVLEASRVLRAMKEQGLADVATMGRTILEDPEFFLAAGAAGFYAADLLEG